MAKRNAGQRETESQRYITAQEFATRMGCSRETVYRMKALDLLPIAYIGYNRFRIDWFTFRSRTEDVPKLASAR